jgi:hypothetical protein
MYLSSCTEQRFKAHLKLIAFILTMIKKVQNKVSINKLISTCSKTDQFLSRADELQVKFRILDATSLDLVCLCHGLATTLLKKLIRVTHSWQQITHIHHDIYSY